jgi:hypothetical protein
VIGARAAGHVLPLTVDPPLRFPEPAVAVIQQRGQVGIGADVHAASAAAVPAVGAAFRHVLLPPERTGASASRTALDMDDCLVDEHYECGVRKSDECRVMNAEFTDAVLVRSG